MNVKKFIGFIILEILLLCFMIYAMREFDVFGIGLFWDLKAFVMFTTIPTIVILINNSPKDIASYLTTIFYENENNALISESFKFIKLIKQTLLYSGILIALISIMMMLSDISPDGMMAKNAGTGLCGIIYSILTIVLIILPIENSLNKRKNKIE